jgi:hypothetical protein
LLEKAAILFINRLNPYLPSRVDLETLLLPHNVQYCCCPVNCCHHCRGSTTPTRLLAGIQITMSEVVNTQLLQVGSHTYRLRARPIGGKPLPQQQQQHYEDDEDAAAAAAWEEHQGAGDAAGAAADDELIDESLISQEGSSFVTRVSVDPQVSRDAEDQLRSSCVQCMCF